MSLSSPDPTFGFRPDMLAKTVRLVELLDAFSRHPFLRDRLALKGGTALNLFVFDLPRLSVDIDLNYVGTGNLVLRSRPEWGGIDGTNAGNWSDLRF